MPYDMNDAQRIEAMPQRASTKKDADDVPDVRADEPERAMEQFTAGLRRVLLVPKPIRRTKASPSPKRRR